MDLTVKVRLSSFVKLFRQMQVCEYRYFVRHSVQVAKLTSEIAKRMELPFAEDSVYMAGLLHDVGLVLKASIENYELFADMFRNVPDLEKVVLTFDKQDQHSMISYMLASQMKPLCPFCAKSILYHHTPHQRINEDEKLVALSNAIKAADLVSLKALRYEEDGKEFDAEFLDQLISSVRKDTGILEEVKKVVEDVLKDFTVNFLLLDDEIHFHSDEVVDIADFEQQARIIAALLDFRSPYTRNHTFACAKLARLVVETTMGKADASLVSTAALLHDIGKVKTPLSILHKKGRLDSNEILIMKRHVVDTYNMLEHAGLRPFSLIGAAHHERLDGSGYPLGLRDEQMLFQQKLLQVCDVFAALVEERPYREAMGIEEALKTIEQEVSGGRLDAMAFEKVKEIAENYDLQEILSFKHVLEEVFQRSMEEISLQINAQIQGA